MSKLVVGLFILLYINVCWAQDTIIDYKSKKVIINYKNPYAKEIYYYTKSPSIKNGKYYYIIDSLTVNYKKIGHFKNNLGTKKWKTYTKQGDLLYIFHYKRNKLHRKETKFANSKILYSFGYRNGLKKGTAKFYSEGNIVAKGKYSGEYIDIAFSDKEFKFYFSNGDTLIYNHFNHQSANSLLKEFNIKTQLNRVWLRKGIWKLYSKDGKLVQKMKYNRNGKLFYKKIYIENKIEYDIW